MRTSSRAQHVVSTIIYWCPGTSSAGGGRGASRGESLAGQALQPAHDPNDHIGTLPRSSGVPSPSEFSPSCIKLWYPDAGAAPLSPVAAGNQVLLLTPASDSFRERAAVVPEVRVGSKGEFPGDQRMSALAQKADISCFMHALGRAVDGSRSICRRRCIRS